MIRIFFFVIMSTLIGRSQQVGYEVYGTLCDPYEGPYTFVTLDTIAQASTIQDLYGRFKHDWIKEYLDVEIGSRCDDEYVSAHAQSNQLSQEQKVLIWASELDCRLEFNIDYIPKNNLSHNPAREMAFSLKVVPIYEAKYPGGRIALHEELKSYIKGKLSEKELSNLSYAKVTFTVDQNGSISNVAIEDPCDSQSIDQVLTAAISSLSKWTPARNKEGQSISQDFLFTIGTDLLRCDYRI